MRFYHLLNGYSFDWFSYYDVKLVLQSLKRKIANTPFAKLPIQPAMLLQFYSLLDMKKKHDAALWAAFLIAFYGFLRKANLVPKSLYQFDDKQHLSRSKITVVPQVLLIVSP